MKEDEILIAEYLAGDEQALAQLVDRHMNAAYYFAFSLIRDHDAAEDVVQESFLKAWNHARSYRPGNSFRSWLFSIVHNGAIDWLRKRKDIPLSYFNNEEGENMILTALIDEAPLPTELLENAQDRAFVCALLQDIDSSYRDVITLHHEGYTFQEIAEQLKKPLNTVKSQYRRALTTLRGLLGLGNV